MTLNPWEVENVQAFSFLKCPECIFDAKEEDIFRHHAVENHPLSFVLFGKSIQDPLVIIKEEQSETENGFSTRVLIDNSIDDKEEIKINIDEFSANKFSSKNGFMKETSHMEFQEDLPETEYYSDYEMEEEEIDNDGESKTCLDCDISFSKMSFLKQHVKSVHEGKKHITRYRYESETGLSYQKACFNQGELFHSCISCKKKFPKFSDLKLHIGVSSVVEFKGAEVNFGFSVLLLISFKAVTLFC